MSSSRRKNQTDNELKQNKKDIWKGNRKKQKKKTARKKAEKRQEKRDLIDTTKEKKK